MNKTILKYGLIAALVLQVGIIANILVTVGVIATVVVLGAALADVMGVGAAKVKLCDAHIYKHKELGTLLYCDAQQATHRDYDYLGTAKVDCDKVGRCSLA